MLRYNSRTTGVVYREPSRLDGWVSVHILLGIESLVSQLPNYLACMNCLVMQAADPIASSSATTRKVLKSTRCHSDQQPLHPIREDHAPMSDPFTLVVSAVGLASFGIQLLQGLNKYAGSALDSRDRIRAISTDIGLAVQVVQALDATIKDDANRALVNDDAERLAQEAQNQCWDIFTKIRDKLPNYSANTGSRKRDIFTWPFKKPNLELLRGNLEKVKTTLQLLMNVIILAAMTKRSISSIKHAACESC